MRIGDIASRRPVEGSDDDSLTLAARRLAEEEVGALVVYSKLGVAGILSERDITRAVADGAELSETSVSDYMTEAPVTLDEDEPIAKAFEVMDEFQIRHVAVTRADEVIGMVSARDLLHAMNHRTTLA